MGGTGPKFLAMVPFSGRSKTVANYGGKRAPNTASPRDDARAGSNKRERRRLLHDGQLGAGPTVHAAAQIADIGVAGQAERRHAHTSPGARLAGHHQDPKNTP